MAHAHVIVCTDGGIGLSSRAIQQYNIFVVPRPVRVGRQTAMSDRGTTLRQINEAQGRAFCQLLEPRLEDFIHTYQRLGANGASIVSLHTSALADDAFRQASVARKVLIGQVNVEVFEARTINAGVTFLTQAAAAFASHGGRTPQQVIALLERLQHEMDTWLLASAPGKLPCQPAPNGWQRLLARILGRSLLFVFASEESTLRWRPWPAEIHELKTKTPRQALIEYHRMSSKAVGRIASQFQSMFPASNLSTKALTARNPALPSRFAQILLFPTTDRLREVERWALKWIR